MRLKLDFSAAQADDRFLNLQRRAWRYLRYLGQSVPELYPQFAIGVLRHYAPDPHWRS